MPAVESPVCLICVPGNDRRAQGPAEYQIVPSFSGCLALTLYQVLSVQVLAPPLITTFLVA